MMRRSCANRAKTRLSSISESSLSSIQCPERLQEWDQDSKELTRTDLREIPIICSICKETYPLYLIYYHKQQHRALTILGYDQKKAPTDMKSLAFRRQEVMSKLIKSSNYNEREKQKIDSSYELLKETLMSSARYTQKEDVQNIGSSPVYETNVRNQFIKAIAICQDQNSAWKSNMEDDFTVVENYGNRPNTCFIGVFDGFHGTSAAKMASAELPIFILDNISKVDPSYRLSEDERLLVTAYETVAHQNLLEIERAFSSVAHDKEKFKKKDFQRIHTSYAKAFLRLDRLLRLGRDEVSRVRWSGCTVVACLIEGSCNTNTRLGSQRAEESQNKCSTEPMPQDTRNKLWLIHVANLGDIHAVLCRSGKSYRLTKEHSTANARERSRVHQAGGSISTNIQKGLVEGITKTTRAIGCHGDPKLKRSVIPAPYAVSIPIDNLCQFLVLASSGLWEVLMENEVVAITQKALSSFLQCHQQSLQRTPKEPQVDQPSMPTGEGLKYPSTTIADDTAKPESGCFLLANNMGTNLPGSEVKEKRLETIYDRAAAFASKQLVKSALLAGSRNNITVMVVLLQGCDVEPGETTNTP
ncbi:protein phosphatase 2C-like domain-containing protein 1 [Ambystoma mexicanum]|uniref:protein phosphatase 2C-like domain-containing protein 1 n=1 Tax=Ambystoma mexicanum TaxID=8296 RepID=UPI0037E86EB2